MQKYAIELIDIEKTYQEKQKQIKALDHFTLQVPQGNLVTLMGGSGCGKSTVSKIIAGIEEHDSGIRRIDGLEYAPGKLPKEIKRRIGYVFQWHNLAQWRTVEGNLFFPLEMFDEKKDASWKARVDKYLDMVGLTKYRDVYPRELSGGMKQRVGIARALMMEPDILVFDQPLGALDAMTRATLAGTLNSLVRRQNKTMLMVTSDLDEAVRYSDIICVMSGQPGRVKEVIRTGITQELREREDFRQLDDALSIKLRLTRAIYGTDTPEEERS